MSLLIFLYTKSSHFTLEVFAGLCEVLEVFSFNFERECLVLVDRSVSNFVDFVELTLENDEVSSFLGIEVNFAILIFIKGVDDLQEMFSGKEELVVSVVNFGFDLFNWVKKCILVEVLLQGGGVEVLNAMVDK